MLGAIIGDIAGSPYEFREDGPPSGDYELFPSDANWTDDTLLTLAVYDGLKAADGDLAKAPQALVESILRMASAVPLPKGGFGDEFGHWLLSKDHQPYGSYGNGAAMRVSSVGWLFSHLDEVKRWAEATAAITHSHPEGIKGAQATAAAIFLARTGATKPKIKSYLEDTFGYDLSRSWEEIQASDTYGMSCQETVPEAVAAFLRAESFADCLRQAISLGGDTDTRAAIAGSIAEGFYGIPDEFRKAAKSRLLGPLPGLLDTFEKQTLPQRLAAIFAPIQGFLESKPETQWGGGHVTGKTDGSPGVMTMPWPNYAPEIIELQRRFYSFSVADFNYVQTVEENGWLRLKRTDLDAVIANLDASHLASLLTKQIRVERFCDGALASALEDGLLAALGRRAFELAQDRL